MFQALNNSIVDAFGTTVSYKAKGQPPVSVSVVIDDSQRMVEVENSPYLHLFVDLANFAGVSPKNGDTVEIRSKSYIVVDVQVDQAGGATLRVQGRAS